MRVSVLARNAGAQALGALLNGGTLDVYGGEQPTDPTTPPNADQPHLARYRFGTPACDEPANGIVESNSLTLKFSLGLDNATWFRCATAEGEPVWDGSVGSTRDYDLVLPPDRESDELASFRYVASAGGTT